jgi:integrase
MQERRENGTGTIYQRSNGSWVGRVYLGTDREGKKKYRYFSGRTQAEVKRQLREMTIKEQTLPCDETVETYLKEWLQTYKKDSVKRSTYDRIETVVRVQIVPYIGMIKMGQLTSKDIQKMLNGLKKEGLAYHTIKKAHDTLNNALTFATDNDDIPKNPMRLVNMPDKRSFPEKEIRFFTEKEAGMITEECRRRYGTGTPVYIYGEAFVLLLNTGLRTGEAIALEKKDWDKQKNVLHVRRNVQSVKKRDEDGKATGGYELIRNSTKTYSGTRDIPLNQTATEALNRLCKQCPESPYIICSSKGETIPPERMERTFYRLLKNAGLEKAGLHSLRHTFASFLFEKKVDIKTISTLLGHSSIQVTMNTYVHLMNNPQHAAVAALDDIF